MKRKLLAQPFRVRKKPKPAEYNRRYWQCRTRRLRTKFMLRVFSRLKMKRKYASRKYRKPYIGKFTVSDICWEYTRNLPDELMLHIFSWLSPAVLSNEVPLVCKRWYNLAQDPMLWKNLTITSHTASTVKICDRLRISPLLKSLTLIGHQDVDVILREVCRSNHQLESLRLCDCRGAAGRLEVSGDLMARVLRSCPRISNLIAEDNTEIHSQPFYRTLAERSLLGHLKNLHVENATPNEYTIFLRNWIVLSKQNTASFTQTRNPEALLANCRYHIEIRNHRFVPSFSFEPTFL